MKIKNGINWVFWVLIVFSAVPLCVCLRLPQMLSYDTLLGMNVITIIISSILYNLDIILPLSIVIFFLPFHNLLGTICSSVILLLALSAMRLHSAGGTFESFLLLSNKYFTAIIGSVVINWVLLTSLIIIIYLLIKRVKSLTKVQNNEETTIDEVTENKKENSFQIFLSWFNWAVLITVCSYIIYLIFQKSPERLMPVLGGDVIAVIISNFIVLSSVFLLTVLFIFFVKHHRILAAVLIFVGYCLIFVLSGGASYFSIGHLIISFCGVIPGLIIGLILGTVFIIMNYGHKTKKAVIFRKW